MTPTAALRRLARGRPAFARELARVVAHEGDPCAAELAARAQSSAPVYHTSRWPDGRRPRQTERRIAAEDARVARHEGREVRG